MASIPSDTTGDTRDALTGLADQSQARETIERWLAEWPRDTIACPMHAMMITLGRIDTVNVAFGESAGDGALVEVAQRIRHFAGDELESSSAWTAARLGGGNFLLVALLLSTLVVPVLFFLRSAKFRAQLRQLTP